jgi:DNA/RNA endonuclease YhcR with UshA esterase domain
MRGLGCVLVLASASFVAPAAAHHSFAAQYDASKPITLTGVVTKVEWMNPHARFYLDVKSDDGTVTNWNLELASPNYLKRAGWSSDSLKEGDVVTVEGSLARSGANMANAATVTLADGTRVFARGATDGG